MASQTPLYQRIVTFILAVLFIASTIGIVVYYVMADKKQRNDQAAINEALKLQQQTKENQVAVTCKSDPSINYTPTPPMQGKPLPNFKAGEPIPTLACTDIVVGTGTEVKTGDTVTAHYTGAVASTGVVFQSSHDSGSPIPFSLNQVINGWSQGVPGMKVGGIRRIYIPASLAYGANPPQGSGIPANADLVFDVEVTKIGQ